MSPLVTFSTSQMAIVWQSSSLPIGTSTYSTSSQRCIISGPTRFSSKQSIKQAIKQLVLSPYARGAGNVAPQKLSDTRHVWQLKQKGARDSQSMHSLWSKMRCTASKLTFPSPASSPVLSLTHEDMMPTLLRCIASALHFTQYFWQVKHAVKHTGKHAQPA